MIKHFECSMPKAFAVVALLLFVSSPAISRADVIIDAVEAGGAVLFSYSGNIDLSGLGAPNTNAGAIGAGGIVPSSGLVSFSLPIAEPGDIWSGHGPFPDFGSGGVTTSAAIGDTFGIAAAGLIIKDGYVSESPLAGSMTFAGTYASLGLTPGVYTVNLPDDVITLNIRAAQVPEPATLALLSLGLAGLGFARRRKK